AIFFSWTTLVKSNPPVPESVPSRSIPVTKQPVKQKIVQAKQVLTQPIPGPAPINTHDADDSAIIQTEPNPVYIPKPDSTVVTASGISLSNGIYYNDFSNLQNS